MLPLSRTIVGCSHVSASVWLTVAWLQTGAAVLGALALVAAGFAWWLLREDEPRAACGRERCRWCEE